MPMFKFQVSNMPSTPVEKYSSSDDSTKMSTTPGSLQLSMSPGSCGSNASSKGNNTANNHRWHNRRRQRSAPRNQEKRPYHLPSHVSPPHDKPMTKNDIYFALDCEMVGVGPEGLDSAVARVTICNWAEKVILDTFVKVPVKVTDYRTFVSGIEAKDLESDYALEPSAVRKMVQEILHGKILIGHALENDLAALQITHPWHDTRDSASYPPFMKKSATDKTVLRPRKLKELVRDRLGKDIQALGEAHDPIEDARSAMGLYKSQRMDWEKLVMKQVASARGKEGRESEPSGRDSPKFNSYQQQAAGGNVPPPPAMQRKNMNFNQSYSLYHRSRSAPTTMMTPHQGGYDPQVYSGHQAYYPQQQQQQHHYLY